MSSKGIPDNLHTVVLSLASEGKSNRAVAEALGKDHGCKVSHVTVGKLLRHLRSERAEIAKAVVREELSTTLTADVRRLERLVKKTLTKISKCANDDLYCRLVEQVRKLIETKLKHSGADEPDAVADCLRGPMIFLPPVKEDDEQADCTTGSSDSA